MNLGSVIRRYRKDKKLTMKVIAEKAGISEGFLSQIENNVNSPSVDTLMNICAAIGISASDVMDQVEKQKAWSLIRKSEWENVDLPHSGFATQRFFPPENRSIIDTAILVVEPDKSIPARKGVKSSQEILCILKGEVELIYGEDTIKLHEGDSIHYWTKPDEQMIVNKTPVRAIAFWLGTF